MKLIIAGSRTIDLTEAEVDRCVLNFCEWWTRHNDLVIEISEVVSGTAAGADALGEAWAKRNGVPVTRFPADWGQHGKGAGPIRNRVMAKYADVALVLWDGKSRGAKHMHETMKKLGKPALLVQVCEDPSSARWN